MENTEGALNSALNLYVAVPYASQPSVCNHSAVRTNEIVELLVRFIAGIFVYEQSKSSSFPLYALTMQLLGSELKWMPKELPTSYLRT